MRVVIPRFPLILVIFISGMIPSIASLDEGRITLRGQVLDFKTKTPIDNATVKIWENRVLRGQNYTDALGVFSIQLPRDRNYRIYICADSPDTPGWDYLPALREFPLLKSSVNFTVELRLGASVAIDHDIQFVDSTSAITLYTYEVRDLTSGDTLDIGGYRLIYGTLEESQSPFLRLNASYLIVPAEVSFEIRVNASAVIGVISVPKSFIINEPGHFRLSRGDLLNLDVRKYSLQYNLGLVEGGINEIEQKMDEMEELGFYLFLEKQRFTSATGIVDRAKFNLLNGAYKDSFKELRRAYIEITDLHKGLVDQYRSAATSVYLLIFFLAFTSTAISFLLLEKQVSRVFTSGCLTALMHSVLHEIYPGADYVPAVSFLKFSTIAWSVSLFTALMLPRFMKGRAVGGRTPLRNIIVPIFSLAKRSLTRRKLRFILTLSSITILVMSFVVLTSFTMGYGLIMRRISRQNIPVEGVLIKAPVIETWKEQSIFTPLETTALEWLQKQREVEALGPKAENQPSLMPIFTLRGNPIYGIIGILPSVEAQILGFNDIIMGGEGKYLRDGDENAILISDKLKKKLGVEVNATLHLGEMMVRVVGIFRAENLYRLEEFDGTSIIPNKLVDFSAPEEVPEIHAVPIETDELVICILETALSMPGVFLSRIDIKLRDGESVNDFAERVALERNYNAWASSTEGLYIAQLGTKFQGKGFPLTVSWIIVILNVVVTMMNSLYERRREVHILSSVGLNPSHLAGVFVAEAITIGLIGGGMGYLLGLGMYKAMALLNITLEVKQKVSAVWSLGALAIAMTAVIIGALAALKGSVYITPSMMRRWRIKGRDEIGEPLEILLPIRIPIAEIDDFMEYVLRILRVYEDDPMAKTDWIRIWREDTEEKSTRGISFVYRTVATGFRERSRNKLIAERQSREEVYTVKMLSGGNRKWVHETGSLIRKIIMQWSTRI
jgi:ABC-type lipoprotein release transport system permease subunit